jgi:Protein kinase domain
VTLTPGSRLGVYEVTAQIVEGGMGQVFRATDTKLKRQVAIKILPPSVAADHDRLARFQREAEVLASLNHPHIAGIYGLEESAGVTALVMELIAGEDLSQRIARGRIPIDEALGIAKQIAEALEAAHEQGVIHRDLKPANIKVRADGTVKVLDFGLAKATDPVAASSPGISMSPTVSVHATQPGIILGTVAYMAPEQACGKAVDKRADIWAFGVVLFEMLTGRQPSPGDDISHVLARVIERDPDWTALPPTPPPLVVRLLRRCLEKDVRRRLRDIADAGSRRRHPARHGWYGGHAPASCLVNRGRMDAGRSRHDRLSLVIHARSTIASVRAAAIHDRDPRGRGNPDGGRSTATGCDLPRRPPHRLRDQAIVGKPDLPSAAAKKSTVGRFPAPREETVRFSPRMDNGSVSPPAASSEKSPSRAVRRRTSRPPRTSSRRRRRTTGGLCSTSGRADCSKWRRLEAPPPS